ncbi:hypothetical protein O0L34_g3623 [Tuta absoluta]|nr:hypothetical protein O0L34_g3623 [Tuta absoluta]
MYFENNTCKLCTEYRYSFLCCSLNIFTITIKNSGVVPVFRRALLFPNRVAVQDETGAYTYSGLYQAALELSKEISKQLLGESRQVIAYMSNNDAVHILTQWAIWMTGNIALPLTSIHPPDMLKYYINDSHAALVICSPEHEKTLGPVAKETKRKLLITSKDKNASSDSYPDDANSKQEIPGKSNKWYGENDALIIYTSGTTSNPKGVVWTHSMLATQIASLHAAWQYSANDVVLHTLPLHHVHGQLNSVNASLAAGARLRMLPSFTTPAVWSRLIGMDPKDEAKVTVFHGVPAMYARLAAEHERMFPDPKTAQYVKQTLSKMRLMCAGSAPLPETLFLKWEEVGA